MIDIIDEIQYIEAAPSKIHALMRERNYTDAVETFTHSLDLVFSDKLVAFHAITGVRNALMECKQTIEDQLVHELHYLIYSKVLRSALSHSLMLVYEDYAHTTDTAMSRQGAFAHFAKANQFSLAAIETELSNDSVLDTEFDKHLLASNQLENDRGSHTFTAAGAPLGTPAASNPLEAAVNAVKKCVCLHVWWLEYRLVAPLKVTSDVVPCVCACEQTPPRGRSDRDAQDVARERAERSRDRDLAHLPRHLQRRELHVVRQQLHGEAVWSP